MFKLIWKWLTIDVEEALSPQPIEGETQEQKSARLLAKVLTQMTRTLD